MYPGRNHPDVQDSRSQLSHYRLLAVRAISGRHQVRRLSGNNHRHVDERMLFVHLTGEGESFAPCYSDKIAETVSARGEAVSRATLGQHFQLIRPSFGLIAIRGAYRCLGVYHEPFQAHRRVRTANTL
jgi:hypothetical protein